MKKIVHLSDLHIGHVDKKTGLETSMIFSLIQAEIIDKCKPADDFVIVITGDLVNDATKDKQLEYVHYFLESFKNAGFSKILIVPGNHDYGTGNNATVDCMHRFKQEIYGDANKTFPDARVIDGIAFIGLDSMQGELKRNKGLWADGEIGEEQRGILDEILSGKKPLEGTKISDCKHTVIYLHHHPIDRGSYFKKKFHGLDDADDLKKVLAPYKIDALLFGHNHDGRPWNKSWGIPRVYDAGSTTGKRKPPGPIRVINLSEEVSEDSDLT